MTRWPNYCPFCGTHSRSGGAASRHTTMHCGLCHVDYSVEYHGAYPADKQIICDERYTSHGGTLRLPESKREEKRS